MTDTRITSEEFEKAANCAPKGPQSYGPHGTYDFQAMLRQGASAERTLAALRAWLESQILECPYTHGNGTCHSCDALKVTRAELDRLTAAAAYIEQLEKRLQEKP